MYTGYGIEQAIPVGRNASHAQGYDIVLTRSLFCRRVASMAVGLSIRLES